ncbi:NAD-dependent epimerase/dehydratase family protein [Streptacidiphilus sp. EB129]|uniref:NAD-dependent epimerase/dehydratase family protein n=1 Tax=Streptacidiphilus sp. EB129 TaxID=3156262 RepID=UPI003511B1D2
MPAASTLTDTTAATGATITVTGAGGFIGGRVVRAAGLLASPPRLRLAVHRRPLAFVPAAEHVTVPADLSVPASLRGLCEGSDVLVHCASLIGGPEDAATAVNVDGTRALLREAARAGVSRIVYLSTASVYGRGVFRNSPAAGLTVAPESATSSTRARAEQAVLEAGGIVARPYLVYGTGDRWVVPGLAALLRALPGEVEGWPARLSLIDADDLARGLLALALAPAADLTASVYHANHPAPVHCAELVRAVAALGPDSPDAPPQRERLSLGTAQQALDGGLRRALDMVTTDHWFDSEPLWRDTRLDPGPGFAAAFPRHADWYRQLGR